MNEITATVFGNIASEPRHTVTAKGVGVTSFRLASTTTRYDQDAQGYIDRDTTFLTVSCWRSLAFNAAASLVKGQPVIVHGTIKVRDWEQDGRSGREVEMDATSVGHDLRRGRTKFERVRPVADRTVMAPGQPLTASEPVADEAEKIAREAAA